MGRDYLMTRILPIKIKIPEEYEELYQDLMQDYFKNNQINDLVFILLKEYYENEELQEDIKAKVKEYAPYKHIQKEVDNLSRETMKNRQDADIVEDEFKTSIKNYYKKQDNIKEEQKKLTD